MWMIARYLPVAPFSLKPAAVTSSGGKTLLVATPFAIKMALLDAALRTLGQAQGEELFPHLRDLRVALAPPQDILIFKTFGKIWRPVESKESKKSGETQEEFEARMREKLLESAAAFSRSWSLHREQNTWMSAGLSILPAMAGGLSPLRERSRCWMIAGRT